MGKNSEVRKIHVKNILTKIFQSGDKRKRNVADFYD